MHFSGPPADPVFGQIRVLINALDQALTTLPAECHAQVFSEIESLKARLQPAAADSAQPVDHPRNSLLPILIDASPDLIWSSLPDGRVDYVNQRWQEYTGLSLEELNRLGWQMVNHPDDAPRLAAGWAAAASKGRPYEAEFRYRGKDGQYRWFWGLSYPMKNDDGQVTRWVGTMRDITERRKMEEAYQESEQRFRVALATVPLLVYTCDCDQRYTWIYNPLHGFRTEDALGKRDDELLPPGTADELVAAKQWALDNEQSGVREVRVHLNGQWNYFILTLEPIKSENGKLHGLTCAALDITEQKQLELQQREKTFQMEIQRRLMENRENERQEIARNLHDGPIQLLSGTIFHLQVVKEVTQDAVMQLELDTATQHLKSTVRELRDVVNELRPPALIRFGLARSVGTHAKDFSTRYPTLKISLHMIDDRQLLNEQACLALFRIYQESLNNVIKHANASRIHVRLYKKARQVHLQISDNGQGFDVSQDMVGQTKSGHYGLVGMKERAEAVGGTFAVFSLPGKGTRVLVSVPISA